MWDTGNVSIVDVNKNGIHELLQFIEIPYTEEVGRVTVGTLQICHSTSQDTGPHANDVGLQSGVLLNQIFHLLPCIQAAIVFSICKEDNLSWLVENPAVRWGEDVVSQALDCLSCGGLSSVVPGGGDPVEDSLPVSSLICIPQTGGAQLKFDVGAEGDHANTDVPTEQVAESAQ